MEPAPEKCSSCGNVVMGVTTGQQIVTGLKSAETEDGGVAVCGRVMTVQ